MTDSTLLQAREAHRLAGEADRLARQHRGVRDRAIRALRADDPQRWTYAAIAQATGVTAELVAAIIQQRSPRRKRRTGSDRTPTR